MFPDHVNDESFFEVKFVEKAKSVSLTLPVRRYPSVLLQLGSHGLDASFVFDW